MIINQLRTYYNDKTTSRIFVDGDELDQKALEDIGRPQGVKIPKETCIPEGVYKVAITMSGRFKKPLMVLYNTSEHWIMRDDIKFTGIRVHSGTRTEHTEGCILLPSYQELQEKVQEELDDLKPVYWVITQDLA